MNHTVFFNGRFLTRPLSGVQRTAYELIQSFDNLLETLPLQRQGIKYVLIYSGTVINPIELKHITLKRAGVFKGNLWEQIELPVYTRNSLLVSLCSISTIFKSKQILMIHDASFFVNKNFFSLGFRMWYKTAIPLIGKICRQIVTVSEFSKKELIKYAGFNGNKISVIYNAADHILKYNEPEKAFKQKVDFIKPYCLAVSNLAANKNFSGLNAAINKIDFSKFNMVIAGGVFSTVKYEAPNENATYLGYVSNEELKYLYKNASLFIFPSFYEGFGIPPLEAMISGCPVIASNTSSMPEVLADAAEYFNPYDTNDMAEKIDTLLADHDRLETLRKKGYERAGEYSWEQSSVKLLELILKYSD